MIGNSIPRYRILKKLGGGGMGVVYQARDTRLDRPVALKFLPPELLRDAAAKQRFVHEARAASALQHRHICTIHDIEETPEGALFICMDLYEGETLKAKIARGPVPPAEALRIVGQIAEGLSAAHTAGMIHRDIKPGNIVLTPDGDVKILDFGLAKLTGQTSITKTGTTVGTVAYMSPEQAGGAPVDHRTDIWALGVLLYELVTGELPFGGEKPAAIYKITNVDPPPLSEHRKGLPAGIQEIVDRALAKDVAERYQSAGEMRADVLRVATGGRPRRRHRILATSLATVVVAALAAAVILYTPLGRTVASRLFPPALPGVQIAILPLENVGGDAADQAFCDGLMETLTSQLSRLAPSHEALWVVPASEVRRSGVTSPGEARRLFSVNFVVTGSVQRIKERYRVNLNLIDLSQAHLPRQVNSSMLDESISTIAGLQDQAAVRVADMLDIELDPERERELGAGGTQISPAYTMFVQGRGYLLRYEREENVSKAIGAFSAAIEQDSLYALAWAGLGEAYWHRYINTSDKRWIEPAVHACRRALAIDDHLAPIHVTLGRILAGTGSPDSAVVAFDRALQLEPADADAYTGLAKAYVRLGRTDDAEKNYKRAIRLAPTYWAAYNDIAWFYFREGRYRDAERAYKKVIEVTPDNTLGYNGLGAYYFRTGDFDRAAELFEKSVAVEPNYFAYTNLSAARYIAGRYGEAAAAAEHALVLNDTRYSAWTNLGNADYWIPGKRQEAADAYRRAARVVEGLLELTPNDAHLVASLAGYYAILGQRDKAKRFVARSLELAPSNPNILYSAAHAYEQLGDRDSALVYIGEAVRHGYTLAEVKKDAFMKKLVADGRFHELEQKIQGE